MFVLLAVVSGDPNTESEATDGTSQGTQERLLLQAETVAAGTEEEETAAQTQRIQARLLPFPPHRLEPQTSCGHQISVQESPLQEENLQREEEMIIFFHLCHLYVREWLVLNVRS